MISSNSEIQSKKTIICSKFSTNSTPFSTFFFNGKEKDYESGFHYYGARYYSSEISMWLSTDPMADKYPSLSPYNYCANNPVKLIDPNGKEFKEEDDTKYVKPYENEVKLRMDYINKLRNTDKWNDSYEDQYIEYSNILNEISDLRNDKNNLYKIKNGVRLGEGVQGLVSYGGTDGKRNIINISLSSKFDNVSMFMEPLAHEMKHAHQFFSGELGFVVRDGKQINSSNSKELEKSAFTRGAMFSGNTISNNRKFKLDYNLDPNNYILPKGYDAYPDNTKIDNFIILYKNNFIHNKN